MLAQSCCPLRLIEPLGSNRVERVDVRIIAATSRDLAAMVAAGTFRADLYFRLNVLPLRLPALCRPIGPPRRQGAGAA